MKILLVRLRQIGDVVFTTPALHALREHYPGAHLTYLVEPAAAAVVRGNPDVDELRIVPRTRGLRGAWADLRLGRMLARERFDLVIDFHSGPRASLLTWLSRAPVRIGYTVAGRSWMYTTAVARSRALLPRHSVDSQWDLLRSIGIREPDRERDPCVMPVDNTAVETVASRLAAHQVPADAQLAVMHVSAGNPFRRWPLPAFAEVAATLAAAHPARRVIVTSGPSEADAAAAVIAAAQARLPDDVKARILACGEFSLVELRALVDRAAVFVGGDSGPMHVAATSRVPIVSLYGPTLPARSAPWRSAQWRAAAVEVHGLECRPCDQRVCAPGDFRCLTRITPAQVIAAAERLLNSGTRD